MWRKDSQTSQVWRQAVRLFRYGVRDLTQDSKHLRGMRATHARELQQMRDGANKHCIGAFMCSCNSHCCSWSTRVCRGVDAFKQQSLLTVLQKASSADVPYRSLIFPRHTGHLGPQPRMCPLHAANEQHPHPMSRQISTQMHAAAETRARVTTGPMIEARSCRRSRGREQHQRSTLASDKKPGTPPKSHPGNQSRREHR